MSTEKLCPICSDKDFEFVLEVILTPELTHYGKLVCPVCQHFGGWVPKPESDPTKYRRPKSSTNLARKAYCELCLKSKSQLRNGRTLEGHHVRPVKYGGDNSDANIWTLCTGCHKQVEHIRTYHGGTPSELFRAL